jgi:hypothetical protein
MSLSMETWTDESMEKPSKVPVNLIGGTSQESSTGSIQVEVGIKGAVHLPNGTMVLWLRGLLW